MNQIPLPEIPAFLEAGYQIFDIRDIDVYQSGTIANSTYLSPNCPDEQLSYLVQHPEFAIVCVQDDNQIPDRLHNLFAHFTVLPAGEPIPNYLPIDVLIVVDQEEFVLDIKHDKKAIIIDVRDSDSFNLKHIVSSVSVPLLTLENTIDEISHLDKIYVVGESAAEAICAASILRRSGLINLRAVNASPADWENAGLPIATKNNPGKTKTTPSA